MTARNARASAGSMATTLQWDASEMIAFDVTAATWWPLRQRLEEERIPYELRGQTLITYKAAQPLIDAALPPRGLTPFDLLRRQQGHRSKASDTIGFVLALAIVIAIVTQSGPVLAALGIASHAARAGLILAAGLAATLLISELVIGPRDPRRGQFVAGMSGLFVAAAWFFACKAWGIL